MLCGAAEGCAVTEESPGIEPGVPVSASWKEAFIAEAAAFPNAKYADQVDGMSQALHALDGIPRFGLSLSSRDV